MANSRSAGDVSVRFSVQDAEVVRKALEALGKDGQAALNQIDVAGKQPSGAMKALSAAMGEARGYAQGLAGPLGIVGEGLLYLGPAGLVAGAALGAVYLLFNKVAEGAKEFGQFSRMVRDNAEAVGFTTSQYQAFVTQLQQYGVEQEKATSFLARFSKAHEEAAHSRGALYDAIKEQNAGLAKQFALAESLPEALNIYARALKGVATEQQRLALLSAAGGKGSALLGQPLINMFDRGGLTAIVNEQVAAGRIVEKELIEQASTAAAKHEERAQAVERNWNAAYAAIYAKWKDFKHTVLGLDPENEVKVSIKIKAAAEGDGTTSFLLGILGRIAGIVSPTAGAALTVAGKAAAPYTEAQLERMRADLAELEAKRGSVRPSLLPAHDAEIARLRGLTATEQFGPSRQPEQFGPAVPSAEETTAANKAEQLRRLNQSLPEDQKRLALLGATATAEEKLRVKEDELTVARLTSTNVTKADTDRVRLHAEVQEAASLVAARSAAGVASEYEIRESRTMQLLEAQQRLKLSDEELASAEKIVARESRDAANAIAVRASATPALTKLGQDAGNLSKNLDENLAGALRGIGQEFSLLNNSTDSFGKKLQNLSLRIADAAYQAVLMKIVIKPLADLVSGGLGSLFGGGLESRFNTPDKLFPGLGSALGNVFDHRGLIPFARGGIVSRPTIFPFAGGIGLMGEAGPEAILPLARGAGGQLGVRSAGRGGNVVHQHFYIDGAITRGDVVTMVKQGAAAAMSHTDTSIKQYDRALPARMGDIQRDDF